MSTWPLRVFPVSSSVVDGGDSEGADMKKVGGRLLWLALTPLTPTQRLRPNGALKPVERAERPPAPDGALKAQALNANEVDETKRKRACDNIVPVAVPILSRLDCRYRSGRDIVITCKGRAREVRTLSI